MGFQPCNLEMKREEARKVLNKLDSLYDFIRNLGLHYKLCENFGCTTITIGRNQHRYSSLYEDLRSRESNLQRNSWPANSKNHSQADDEFYSKSLAEVTAKLSETLAQVASLKEVNSRIRTEASQAAI